MKPLHTLDLSLLLSHSISLAPTQEVFTVTKNHRSAIHKTTDVQWKLRCSSRIPFGRPNICFLVVVVVPSLTFDFVIFIKFSVVFVVTALCTQLRLFSVVFLALSIALDSIVFPFALFSQCVFVDGVYDDCNLVWEQWFSSRSMLNRFSSEDISSTRCTRIDDELKMPISSNVTVVQLTLITKREWCSFGGKKQKFHDFRFGFWAKMHFLSV